MIHFIILITAFLTIALVPFIEQYKNNTFKFMLALISVTFCLTGLWFLSIQYIILINKL